MSQIQKIIIISTFLFVAGCGQKGDLYLPGQKAANIDQDLIQLNRRQYV